MTYEENTNVRFVESLSVDAVQREILVPTVDVMNPWDANQDIGILYA